MDLPTCPACGQSVLDEDAENCPFCGASMSGPRVAHEPKPVSTPEKPAAKSPEASTAVSPPPRKAERSKAAAQPDDLDPISADADAAEKAFRVRRKRAKGLSLPVKCPMCETTGWIPPKMAGQPVRCANRDCLVPVFTAPEPEPTAPEPEPEPQPRSGPSLTILISLAAAVLIGAGVWIWVAVFGPTGELDVPESEQSPLLKLAEQQARERADEQSENDPTENDPREADADPAVRLAELREAAFERMIELSQRAKPFEKPIGRQRTAVAFARSGRLAEAEEQLQRLKTVDAGNAFYHVAPLVELGWRKLAADETDEARAFYDRAREAAQNPPRSGRSMTAALADLASLAVALEVDPGVVNGLLGSDRNGRPEQRLAAEQRLAVITGGFDLADEIAVASYVEEASPIDALVVANLVARDRGRVGLRFAGQPSDDADAETKRIDRLIALGELAALDPSQDALVTSIEQALPPAARAVLAARIASRRHLAGNEESAGAALTKAEQMVEALPEPESPALPGLRALHAGTHGLGEGRPWAVLAAAELARARMLFGQPFDQVWAAFERTGDVGRDHAPPAAVTSARLQAIGGTGAASLASELKTTLQLVGDTDVQNAVVDYRAQLRELDEAARRPLVIRARLLADLVTTEAAKSVWDRLRDDEGATLADLAAVDDSRRIAGRLLATLDSASADELEERLAGLGLSGVAPLPSAEERLGSPDRSPAELVRAVRANQPSDRRLLHVAALVQDRRGLPDTLAYLAAIEDVITAGEGTRLAAAAAAKRSQSLEDAWNALGKARGLSNLPQITACEGFLLGTAVRPAAAPATAAAETR